VFHTDKEPGITASSPILDKRGGCAGVFGLDVELKELSGFLKTLRIGESGMGFIVNHKDELVAYPDFSQVVKHGTAGFRVATVQEVTEPAVRTCFSQHTKKGGGDFTFVCEGKHYLASVRAFPESFAKDWRMVVVVPKDDFVGILKRANRVTVLISLLFLGIAAGVSLALSRRISRPILTLSKDMQQIKDFDLEGQTDLSSPVKEIQIMANAMSSMRKGLRAFRRYVPADLVRQLIQTGQEARLGGEKRELTILFTDITGFTDVSEDMDPEELMLHYSEYLKALTDIIMAHHGTIDKYTGDGIMAFWGAPVHDPRHAFSACQGTLACCHKVLELNEKWKQEGKKPLPTRFGLHTGETIVGNMGSSERMNYSALGDSVNLASRLESANKTYGTAIMVSENTFRLVSDDFLFRPLDIIVVKGRKKGIKVYELMAEKGDKSAFEKEALCMDFIQGFDRYLQKDWEGAISIFEKLRERFPWDRPAEIYLKRCTAFRQSPPGAHWNGIVHLDQK
jgi:adenylate cyclase